MKKRVLKIIITALIVLGISLLAIYLFSKGAKQEVMSTVVTYNNVLRKAHIEMNSSLMGKLVSERQMKKIDSYIAFNYKNGRIIGGELKDLKFQDIKIEGDSATASTIESWSWSYLDPVSRKSISDTFVDLYANTYFLKKTEGHWIVDDLESNVIDATGK